MANKIEHKHLIVSARVNKPPLEGQYHELWYWLYDLITALGMKAMASAQLIYLNRPGLRGWTALCPIETSHIAMHSWDEELPARLELDVYSCGPVDPQIIFDALRAFDVRTIEHKFLDRENGLELIFMHDPKF